MTSLSGLYQANFFSAIEREERHESSSTSEGGRRGDTVSLSAEARVMAEALTASKKTVPAGEQGDGPGGYAAERGNSFVNGKWTSEEELAAEIRRAEEEVDELGTTLSAIMEEDDTFDGKIRRSEPVRKRLEVRTMELQDLKTQAAEITANKRAEAGRTAG